MKKTMIGFAMTLICAVLCCQCNTAVKRIDSYNIVRSNFFSNSYILPLQDTNKVDKRLYLGIFDKIKLEHGAKCLLMKVYAHSVVWEEYGLYDYKNQKFYYTSIENNNLYHFKEVNRDSKSGIFDKIKTFIGDYSILQKQVQQPSTLYDGDSFEVSIIQVDSNVKEVLVKSYYW